MNHFLSGLARAVAESFPLPDPILEIGSYQVAGQEDIADLRVLFPGKKYIGVDARPGPGVDQVADVQKLPFADQSVGTILAMSTFEHVPRFWKAFDELHRVLRPDGVLFITVPFYFHIHSYPSDYWRFTPEALDLMLEDYPQRLLGWHGPERRPANVWALAFGEKQPRLSEENLARYRHLLNQYGREPLSFTRRCRYLLARWLCGRRPVAPYLDREKWDTICRTPSSAMKPMISQRRRAS